MPDDHTMFMTMVPVISFLFIKPFLMNNIGNLSKAQFCHFLKYSNYWSITIYYETVKYLTYYIIYYKKILALMSDQSVLHFSEVM